MSNQVVIIGGGTSFNSYKEYISFLNNTKVNLDRLKSRKDWKDSLGDLLGDNFDVYVPKMPNITYARYEEWKNWIEKIIPLLGNSITLIGHSLGGIFLAKYLSENDSPKKIMSTIFVSAPFDIEIGEEKLFEFSLDKPLDKLTKQGGKIYLIHSEDDPVVPIEQLNKYKNSLPSAEVVLFKDRGHFKQESFPN